MLYWIAFAAVVFLDTLCVKYIFPELPGSETNVGFFQAFLITITSAVVIGIVFLEFGGGLIGVPLLQKLGLKEALAVQIVKNLYFTLAPLLCGYALVIWTKYIPGLGFHKLWPNAFIAGIILDFIDHGIIGPWFFKLAEALKIKGG